MDIITEKEISVAVECMRQGGIVAYPTETVYGLGCDPWNEEACCRIQAIKQRHNLKPMLVIASSIAQIEYITGKLEDLALELANEFWPGPLTLIIKPRPEGFPPVHLIGKSGGIAVRVTSNPVAGRLAEIFGKPVVSTSANITGDEPSDSYKKAIEVFDDRIDVFIKCENSTGIKVSTIVDITDKKPVIIREGAIPSEKIFSFIKKHTSV